MDFKVSENTLNEFDILYNNFKLEMLRDIHNKYLKEVISFTEMKKKFLDKNKNIS